MPDESGAATSTVRRQTVHGKPNARKRRSARRPGKRERARVKNNRGQSWHVCAGFVRLLGAGTVHVKAGRKKARKIAGWLADLRFPPDPSSGEPGKPERAGGGGTAELLSRRTLIVGDRHRREP